MAVEGPIWEKYDQAARGLPVEEPAEFEWMLESPGEFELRVLLRHFEEREVLLERIGRYELDGPLELSDEEAEAQAESFGAACKRAAHALAPSEFPWAGSPNPLKIEWASGDALPASREMQWLHDRVATAALRDLSQVQGGHALHTALAGRVQSLALYYLLGPLLKVESDFSPGVELAKSGRAVWIDNGTVLLKRSRHPNQWANAPGWNPTMSWPTDADIATHQAERRQARQRALAASDPSTSPDKLAEYAQDEDVGVRAQLTRNPALPDELVRVLQSDNADEVLAGLVSREYAAPEILDRALSHPSPVVRRRLAERAGISDAMRRVLADDPDITVRRAIGANTHNSASD